MATTGYPTAENQPVLYQRSKQNEKHQVHVYRFPRLYTYIRHILCCLCSLFPAFSPSGEILFLNYIHWYPGQFVYSFIMSSIRQHRYARLRKVSINNGCLSVILIRFVIKIGYVYNTDFLRVKVDYAIQYSLSSFMKSYWFKWERMEVQRAVIKCEKEMRWSARSGTTPFELRRNARRLDCIYKNNFKVKKHISVKAIRKRMYLFGSILHYGGTFKTIV